MTKKINVKLSILVSIIIILISAIAIGFIKQNKENEDVSTSMFETLNISNISGLHISKSFDCLHECISLVPSNVYCIEMSKSIDHVIISKLYLNTTDIVCILRGFSSSNNDIDNIMKFILSIIC